MSSDGQQHPYESVPDWRCTEFIRYRGYNFEKVKTEEQTRRVVWTTDWEKSEEGGLMQYQ